MRTWLSELRIGLIAGASAGAILLAAPFVANMMRHTAADATASAASWTPPLLDPIHTAGTALAQGDSSFIAVVLDDSVRFPGITAAMSAAAAHESVRVYSPQSTGLRGARWAAFVPKVVPYAAAYNAVVQIARQHSRRRA